MAGRIICIFVCILSAFPFFMLALLGKDSRTPMHFWAGSEEKMKSLVKNVPDFNRAMAKAYSRYACGFLVCALLFLLNPALGVIGMVFLPTAGLFWLWQTYCAIVRKYS